jgi:hypothetical protein
MMSFLNNQQIDTEQLQKQIANAPMQINSAMSYKSPMTSLHSNMDNQFVGAKAISTKTTVSSFGIKRNSK